MKQALHRTIPTLVALGLGLGLATTVKAQPKPNCPNGMRPLQIGISVVPPKVVHTTPYIAKELGFFEKYCIDATITPFEGGSSAALMSALSGGKILANLTEVMVGSGMKVKQIWSFAPRLPHAYAVSVDIKTGADLKGKRLSAAGGGVGSFNWRIGRALLEDAGLTVDDAKFIPQGTAGTLPGLLSGQIDGVALHPEDVYRASKQKPGIHVLATLADMMPNYVVNTFGAADSFIARDRDLLVDAVAAMIEANRFIYANPDTVIPVMMKVTEQPRDMVEFALSNLIKNCVWAVNTGIDKARTEWSIKNSVEAGDIPAERNLTFDQLVNMSIAEEAVKRAGGPVTINNCSL